MIIPNFRKVVTSDGGGERASRGMLSGRVPQRVLRYWKSMFYFVNLGGEYIDIYSLKLFLILHQYFIYPFVYILSFYSRKKSVPRTEHTTLAIQSY